MGTRMSRRTDTADAAESLSRQKQVELAASGGAGLLGAGIGVLFASWLRPAGVLLLVVGAVLHGWGMLVRHRLERRGHTALPRWSVALFWLCWLVLLGLAAYLLRPLADRSP